MIQFSQIISYLKKQQTPLFVFSFASFAYPLSRFIFTRVHTYLFPPEKPKTDIERYVEKQLDSFKQFSEGDLSRVDRNNTISHEFYDKKLLSDVLQDANNGIESAWKSRVLFEYTPRGNIVMYYDPYKLGFAYYSDNAGIPYNLLNAVAMKYVKTFRCQDFFFDNYDIDRVSMLIKLHSEEEKKEVSKEEKKESDDFKAKLKDAPFLKRKKTEQKKEEKDKKVEDTDKETEEKPKYRNCFVHMGKMYNFSFLNSLPPIKRNKISFSSDLLNALDQETDLQKQVLSWKDYKKTTLV
jgi:hypothetical protein